MLLSVSSEFFFVATKDNAQLGEGWKRFGVHVGHGRSDEGRPVELRRFVEHRCGDAVHVVAAGVVALSLLVRGLACVN